MERFFVGDTTIYEGWDIYYNCLEALLQDNKDKEYSIDHLMLIYKLPRYGAEVIYSNWMYNYIKLKEMYRWGEDDEL